MTECGTKEELGKEIRVLEIQEIVNKIQTRNQVLESHLDLQLMMNDSLRKELSGCHNVFNRKLKTAQQPSRPNKLQSINKHTADLKCINRINNIIETGRANTNYSLKQLTTSL